MKDIERLLDKAASDVKASVRHQTTSGAMKVPRRGLSVLVTVSVATALLVAIGAATLAVTSQLGAAPGAPTGMRSATETSILADGIVTEEEYRGAVQAVVDCGRALGLEVTADFNDPNGHAGFQSPGSIDDSRKQFDQCLVEYLPNNVSVGWSVSLGDVDLDEMRNDAAARLACVENRTGQDFGELTYDEFGYPTPMSQATMEAALDYQEHEPWNACSKELFPERWSGAQEPDSPVEVRWEIMTRNGMRLFIGSRSEGGCLEITDGARAIGVCGADTTIPLSFSTGALYGKGFIAGWTPINTTRVVFTLADGTVIETTDLGTTEEYDVRFFLETVPINERYKADVPITAVALDDTNIEIARFVLTSETAP
ncbi:hypothetical protein BMS3Bbin02_00123 [bacterium BMS3Bbin02]|nr:hypothetical protein BMS3Bbin02_00123 [bacterium BMS3Bbin02]